MYEYLYNPYFDFRAHMAYIRVLHASPNAPAVDIYANGNLWVRGLSYRGFTEYKQVIPGAYNIKVFPAGQTVNPLINTHVNITARSILTAAVIGMLPNLSLLPVTEPLMHIPTGKTFLRFVHLSPDTPGVDVLLSDGTVLFGNVAYTGITNYIPVTPSTYTFYLNPTGTVTPVLYVPNIRLYPDKFYTIYAVGLSGGIPGLQVLIPLDGNTYIKF